MAFLRTYIATHGYAPTSTEIKEAVGLASPNTVRQSLGRLAADGHISVRPRIARAIVLLNPDDPRPGELGEPGMLLAQVDLLEQEVAQLRRDANPGLSSRAVKLLVSLSWKVLLIGQDRTC